jgi:hypothetical protein
LLRGVGGIRRAGSVHAEVFDGIAFSDFGGYDTWESVAPSQTNDGIKVVLAMIKAHKGGTPNNGDVFSEGSGVAKVEWSEQSNPECGHGS